MTFEGVSEMSEIFVDICVRNTCVHVTFLCEVDACFLIQEVWPWESMLLLRVFMKVVCVCVCVCVLRGERAFAGVCVYGGSVCEEGCHGGQCDSPTQQKGQSSQHSVHHLLVG